MVNKTFDPEHMIDILFPVMSIIDSVFAAQLLLCLAFGGWLNAVMKWYVNLITLITVKGLTYYRLMLVFFFLYLN